MTNSGGVSDETDTITIAGDKTGSSRLVNIVDDFDTPDTYSCVGTDVGSSSWSCTIRLGEAPDYGDSLDPGDYGIQITEQNADGTVLENVLTFTVYDGESAAGPIVPQVAYEFSPAAVKVVVVPAGHGRFVAADILANGEGYDEIAICPSDSFSGDLGVFGAHPPTKLTCSTNDFPPSDEQGPYLVRATQGQWEGEGSDRRLVEDDSSLAAFWVPENDIGADDGLPLTFTQDATDRTVTVSGSVTDETAEDIYPTSTTNGTVDILDSNGEVVCSTHAFTQIASSDNSSFVCPTRTLSYGAHSLSAVIVDNGMASGDDFDPIGDSGQFDGIDWQYVTGAMSSALSVGTVDFPAPLIPVNRDLTPVWTFTVTGNLVPGGTITISGSGLPPGTSVDSILHSVPTDLGSVVVAGDGTFTHTVTIPKNEPVGNHTVIVTASGPGIVTSTQQQPITLTGVPSNNTGGGTKASKLPTVAHGSGFDANGSGTAIQPNILTRALTPIADVAVHPNKIISAIEIGLVLLLLAVLPAHLLNATIAEQSDRFERRFKRFPKRPRWLTRLIAWFRSAPVVGGLVVTLVTALLFGFADPRFGWTLASLRLILACGIALFLVGYVANWLTSVIARNAVAHHRAREHAAVRPHPHGRRCARFATAALLAGLPDRPHPGPDDPGQVGGGIRVANGRDANLHRARDGDRRVDRLQHPDARRQRGRHVRLGTVGRDARRDHDRGYCCAAGRAAAAAVPRGRTGLRALAGAVGHPVLPYGRGLRARA